jgi:hypothetical protein
MITRLFTLLFFVTVVSGQTLAPPEIHVKLSLAENKAVYRNGEPIRILLEFNSDREGYVVENTHEGNDPMSDKIVVYPATGITHWYAELMDNRLYGRDYFSYEKLTSSPARVEIVLNDSLRFDNPGRYTVSVTTSRVRKASKDFSGESFTATTNAVSFEVQAMSDEDEAKEVKRYSELLNAARDVRSRAAIEKQMSYLTGDPSTREKVRRCVDPADDDRSGYLYTGLFISRNRALAVRLLEAAMRDPKIPVTGPMLNTTIRLKVLLNYGVSERPVGPTVKDESLPEVDASLLEQIRKLARSTNNRDLISLRPKTQLLARFATESIYPELMQLYQEVGANLQRDARAGLLAYFAKHNEREAMPLIEQAVAELKPGEYPQVLSDLTKLYYSDAIGALLKKLMDMDDAPMASNAAYLIGVHGSAGDEKLLEARLKRWQEQWRDRVADADAQLQGQIERELIYALIHGNSWKLSPERVRELQMSCLTQMCKDNNRVPQ